MHQEWSPIQTETSTVKEPETPSALYADEDPAAAAADMSATTWKTLPQTTDEIKVVYVWTPYSLFLLSVFLVLGASFVRRARKKMRKRRIIRDYQEAHVLAKRPRICRMFAPSAPAADNYGLEIAGDGPLFQWFRHGMQIADAENRGLEVIDVGDDVDCLDVNLSRNSTDANRIHRRIAKDDIEKERDGDLYEIAGVTKVGIKRNAVRTSTIHGAITKDVDDEKYFKIAPQTEGQVRLKTKTESKIQKPGVAGASMTCTDCGKVHHDAAISSSAVSTRTRLDTSLLNGSASSGDSENSYKSIISIAKCTSGVSPYPMILEKMCDMPMEPCSHKGFQNPASLQSHRNGSSSKRRRQRLQHTKQRDWPSELGEGKHSPKNDSDSLPGNSGRFTQQGINSPDQNQGQSDTKKISTLTFITKSKTGSKMDRKGRKHKLKKLKLSELPMFTVQTHAENSFQQPKSGASTKIVCRQSSMPSTEISQGLGIIADSLRRSVSVDLPLDSSYQRLQHENRHERQRHHQSHEQAEDTPTPLLRRPLSLLVHPLPRASSLHALEAFQQLYGHEMTTDEEKARRKLAATSSS